MKYRIQAGQLTWRDKWLAMRAGLLIPAIEIWMRKSSFQKCQSKLQAIARLLTKKNTKIYTMHDALHIAKLVELGNNRYSFYPADCLTRGLVVQYFLTRHGVESKLCLGVRTITGQFEAHAWVEVDKTPLNEVEPVQDIYTAFDWTTGSKGMLKE